MRRDEHSEAIKSTVVEIIFRMVLSELGVAQFLNWVSLSLDEMGTEESFER